MINHYFKINSGAGAGDEYNRRQKFHSQSTELELLIRSEFAFTDMLSCKHDFADKIINGA